MGRDLRRRVPRRSLGKWAVQVDRRDPVQLIIESHRGRLDWLVPIRVGRMAAPPYGFLRGAGNFGFYASPEQHLVINLNDFDEAHPGGLGVGSSSTGREHLGGWPPKWR